MATDLKPIRNDRDHDKALKEINRLWGAKRGTPAGDRFEILGLLVEAYEKEHFPIDPPTAIEAIEFRLEQMGLTRKDLEPMIGTRARVSEVLNGKRQMTLAMMRRINNGLGIPMDTLARLPVQKKEKKAA